MFKLSEKHFETEGILIEFSSIIDWDGKWGIKVLPVIH